MALQEVQASSVRLSVALKALGVALLDTGWLGRSKGILLGASIFLLAVVPRLGVAVQMSWLSDEIFYVDFINSWFQDHFFEYFFQLTHLSHPPASPIFGNPPLGMWVMTVGMSASEGLGGATLLGARLVNVMLGSGACVLLFFLGKRFYSLPVAILAGMLLAWAPPMVAVDGSAYLDSLTTFLVLLDVYLFFLYWERPKQLTLSLLALALGLTVLTKFTPLLQLGTISIAVLYRQLRQGEPLQFLGFAAIASAVPFLLWAGARDLHHVQAVIDLQQGGGPLRDVIGSRFLDGPDYYFLMILGRLPEATTVVVILGAVALLAVPLLQSLPLRARLASMGEGIRFEKDLFLLALSAATLLFLFHSSERVTFHRIAFALPLIFISTSDLALGLLRGLSRGRRGALSLLIAVFVAGSALPLLTWSPGLYNAYNNVFVGGVTGSRHLYRTGDGEGLDVVGEWLRQNAPSHSQISAIGFNYVLQEYVGPNQTVVPHFVHETMHNSRARGSDYVVIHNFFQADPAFLFVQQQLEKAITPEYVFYLEGSPYISLYNISQEVGGFPQMEMEALQHPEGWEITTASSGDAVELRPGEGGLLVDYSLTLQGWVAFSRLLPIPPGVQGLAILVEGDGQGEALYLDLVNSQTGGYLRYQKFIGWSGEQDILINLESMRSFNGAKTSDGFDELKISLDKGLAAATPLQGRLRLSDLRFILAE